jgi:hypothetical protein
VQNLFSQTLPAPVWQVMPDLETQTLIIARRTAEGEKLQFSALALPEKRWLWQQADLPEDVRFRMAGAGGGKLILQFFPRKDLPETSGIHVFDTLTGKSLWQHPTGQFRSYRQPGIEIRENQGGDFQMLWLEATTGSICPFPPELPGFRQKPLTTHYREGDLHFKTLQAFVEKITGEVPVRAADYAEIPGFIVLSYYLYGQKGLSQYLLLTDRAGKLHLHLCLGSNLPGISEGAFLLAARFLIFIQHQTQLFVYDLPADV